MYIDWVHPGCQPVWWFCWLFRYHFYRVFQPKPTNTHPLYLYCFEMLGISFTLLNNKSNYSGAYHSHASLFPIRCSISFALAVAHYIFSSIPCVTCPPHSFNRNICHRHIDFTLYLHAFRRVLHFIVCIQRFNFDVNSCFSMFMMTFLHLNA